MNNGTNQQAAAVASALANLKWYEKLMLYSALTVLGVAMSVKRKFSRWN